MAIEKNKSSLTILGPGTSFEGKIDVPQDLTLYGDFHGEVKCRGEVTIGVKGNVRADINAKSAIIGGRLEGNLICSGTVELEENSVLIGNISAKELVINKGATFQGNSSMGDAAPKQAVEAAK